MTDFCNDQKSFNSSLLDKSTLSSSREEECRITKANSGKESVEIFVKDDFNSLVQISDKENSSTLITMVFVLKNLIPNIGSAFLYYFIGMLETHFVGQQKDNNFLDGMGLALIYSTTLFYYNGNGISEGLSIVCSKYNGQEDFKMINIHTKQARFLSNIYTLIYVLLNIFFLDEILEVLAPGVSYKQISKQYILFTMPSILLELHFEISAKYVESQMRYKPVLFGLLAALIVNPICCYLTLVHFKLGVLGCIITTNATSIVKIIVITLFSMCHKRTEEEKASSGIFDFTDFFKDFQSFFSVSMYCILANFVGCAGNAVTGFIAVRLGVNEYAKYIVLGNFINIFVVVQYGFYNTCCILVGNMVGANQPNEIRKLMRKFIWLGVGFTITLCTLIGIFHDQIAFFFSEHDNIKGSGLILEILLVSSGEGLVVFQMIMIGYINGLGRIRRTTGVTFIFNMLLLPGFSYFLGIHMQFGLFGMIFSLFVIHFFSSLSVFIMAYKMNIQKCCDDYQEQMVAEEEEKSRSKSLQNEEEDDYDDSFSEKSKTVIVEAHCL